MNVDLGNKSGIEGMHLYKCIQLVAVMKEAQMILVKTYPKAPYFELVKLPKDSFARSAFLCDGAHAIFIMSLWKTIAYIYHGRLCQITRVFGDMLSITCAFFIIVTIP